VTDRAAAVAYLMPPTGSFWKWVDNGRSIAWQTGDTIAFSQELLTVMQRLAPAGLPPLSSLVLLLAATRDGWSHNSNQLQAHAEQLALPGGGDPASAIGVTLRAIGHRLGSDTASLRSQLDRIAALPRNLHHPLSPKAVLAEMVFENVPPAIAPEVAGQVIAELQSGVDPGTLTLVRPVGNALRELIASIDALKRGAADIDADRLALRMRTGLDELIDRPQKDLGPSQRVRQLMAELSDDPELGGLSRLASKLLPAVQVPRTLRHQEAVQTGGVADITNRGQLDRLLISELANDDLTLAVRVAVNEALYIQRESPPRDPPERRVILIDCGIRLWGLPRFYAAAAALALAANGDASAQLNTFRPDGKIIVPIELSTREGLVSHLEALDPRPHFADAFPAFVTEISNLGQATESFLITHEEVLDDAEFRLAVARQDRLNCYAATVARDGTFRLWSLKSTGRSLLRQATLDLNQLLARPAKPPVRSVLQPVADLPVILSIDRFPLLLPPGQSLRRFIAHGAGPNQEHVGITRDHRLITWNSRSQGAQMLSDRVPAGRLELFRFTLDGDKVVALFATNAQTHRYTLWVVNLCSLWLAAPIELLGIEEKPVGAELREEIVYLHFKHRAAAYGFQSGEPLATLDTARYRWVRGRFYRAYDAWYLLTLVGSRLVMERIPGPVGLAEVFEVNDFPGLLCMRESGEITTIDPAPTAQLIRTAPKESLVFLGMRADGRAIIACTSGDPNKFWSLAFHPDSTWVRGVGPVRSLIHCNSQQRISLADPYSLRRQFVGVLINTDGGLTLVCKGNKLLQPRLVGRSLVLVDAGFMLKGADDRVRSFSDIATPPGTGYRLRAVSWEGKGRIFLDSRGLLHLKSANTSIPEITIVLVNQGPLAGWSSDGRVYGPKYFHGSDVSHDPSHLADLIRRFTENLR
jgi:hypothetical protein